MSLLRARNYGVRVVLTHTSHISGIRSATRAETTQKLELRLTDPRESEVPRVDGRSNAREVPDTPGRGLSPAGFHLMVGCPRWPTSALAGRALLSPKNGGHQLDLGQQFWRLGVVAALCPYRCVRVGRTLEAARTDVDARSAAITHCSLNALRLPRDQYALRANASDGTPRHDTQEPN